MANSLLGLAFLSPVTAVPVGAAAAPTHPATNVLSITRPRRTWRSTLAGSPKTIVLDFGTPTPITGGVFLNNANFASVFLSASNDLVSYTDLLTWRPVPLDARVSRRKGLYLASDWLVPFNYRYLAVGCDVVDTPSPGYFELGAVAVLASLAPLVNNWGVPHAWTPTEAVTRVAYAGGGSEITLEGPPRLVYDLQGAPWRTAALAQLLALRALGQDAAFVLAENRGDPAHVYLLKRIADVQVRESFRTFEAAWQFEECL